MLIYDQETFLIITNVENSRAEQYFCENCDALNFSELHSNVYIQQNDQIQVSNKVF